MDQVSGEVTQYKGDLWPEICTVALEVCGGDLDRARKRAQASHKSRLQVVGSVRSFGPLTGPLTLGSLT